MKLYTLNLALGLFLALTTASAVSAQALPAGLTNFPMVGITAGQTLQINVVAFPPNPCTSGTLGFQDSDGVAVGPSQTFPNLPPGTGVSLAWSPVIPSGARVELLPTVTGGAPTDAACVATVEVITSGATSVLIPGAVGYPPNPALGLVGVASGQTLRLNVVAFPPDPCIGTITFADKAGNQLAPEDVSLSPGQATRRDLAGPVNAARAEVYPVVTVTSGACIASAEVVNNQTLATAVYYPPDPCSPTSTSCVVF